MCSEGFSFIVGVWDWTGVCVVLVMLSSSRRRGCVINFSPLGGAHALRFNPSLQNMKNKGSLARNARFGLLSHKMGDHFRVLDACQCKCIVVSQQAQHFVMWPFAMSWQAQHFVTCRRCCFDESQWQGHTNIT